MLRSGSVRRVLAATGAAGLAAGLIALPNAAQAAVHATYFAEVEASTHYTGAVSGAACKNSATVPSTGQSKQTTPLVFTSGTHHVSESQTATFTNTANPSDKVTISGHISSTMAIAKSGQDLKSLSLTASGSIAVANSLSSSTSNCVGTGEAYAEAEQLQFTEHSAGWLSVTRATGVKNAIAVYVLTNAATGNGIAFDLFEGNGSQETAKYFLPAGSYDLVAEMGLQGGHVQLARNGTRVARTATQQVSVKGSFVKAGSPAGPASGAARNYVVFPASVSCSSSSATMQWTGAAGKVSSGVFLVNGKQKGSSQSPFPGEKVKVGVPGSANAKITAKVKLKSGKTVTASRSYYACKG